MKIAAIICEYNPFHNGHKYQIDEAKETIFYSMMESGHYFPQIMQFVYVMIGICRGNTSFVDILISNLVWGTGYMILWYLLKMYMLPGINTVCSFIGGTIFKFRINWVAIIIAALFVINDWKALLYCIIAAALTSFVKVLMFTWFSNVKYNDKVAFRVSRFRT